MHERTEIWNFSRGVQLGVSRVSTANEWYTRREIPYLQVITYYFGFLFERLVITRSRLFEKGTRCLSHMALNIVSDLRVADFSRVEYFFFSVVEILMDRFQYGGEEKLSCYTCGTLFGEKF